MSVPESFFQGFGKVVQLSCVRRVSTRDGNGAVLLSLIRILIADDFKDWRRQVRLLFKTRPEWQVVAEAADGLEAIQKAEELKPNLIVLDIGLPKLNGIEAARRIRRLSPSSKIVFLSQDHDPGVVQAALGTGAQGYVYKTDVRRDFLPAIQAAMRDRQFVSRSLRGYAFVDTSEGKVSHRHEVHFFSDDAVFLDTVARFVVIALKAGNAAIVVATESHRDGIVRRMKKHGLDVDAATQQGKYVQLDVAKTLSTFMVNGMPDPARFFEIVGGLIKVAAKAAKQEHPRVVACGECSAFLWAQGKPDAALRLEQLWDDLGQTLDVDILCAYALSSFRGKEDEPVFQSICAEHPAVYPR
jgi:DNA-binding NarL/FixJ family response regulator